MKENGNGWTWTEQRERVALLLAENELTDAEIIAEVDIGLTTLHRWKHVPAFAARVDELARELAAGPRKYAIARRNRRVAELQRRYDKLLAIIEARANHPDYQDLPGGRTGLLVRRLRMIGRGAESREVVEYELDTGLLKEMREIEKQAAVEVGDWTEKRELIGQVKVEKIEHLSDEELERIAAGSEGG